MSDTPHFDIPAYFITFRRYGSWLHGDERGSVDKNHNMRRTPMLPPQQTRETRERALLKHPPGHLSPLRLGVVVKAIAEHCLFRGWDLIAVNVRSNHVHLVVTADGKTPEYVMTKLKQRATRLLREAGLLDAGMRIWSEHGSTIYLWRAEQVASAVWYVLEGQEKSSPSDH